jgi:hypothetical protein
MAMSMILDRTLSMRCPSVRQSSAIRWLVEMQSGGGRTTPVSASGKSMRNAKLIEPVLIALLFSVPENWRNRQIGKRASK